MEIHAARKDVRAGKAANGKAGAVGTAANPFLNRRDAALAIGFAHDVEHLRRLVEIGLRVLVAVLGSISVVRDQF